MKTKELKKINISINGDENNKTEIVYNNVIQNLGLSEEEQIKYLRSKITELEIEKKNRSLTLLLILISILGISFGIFLMIKDLYFLGSIFIVTTFIGVVLRFSLMYKNLMKNNKNLDYDRVEQIRKLLNDRIR